MQEALVAALAGEASFAGRSNLRTWLTGILKHKIVDIIRRAARESTLAPDPLPRSRSSTRCSTQRGHWVDAPSAWPDPDNSLEQKQFFAVLEDCLRACRRRPRRPS